MVGVISAKSEYPSTENTGKDEEREYSEGVGGVGRRAAADINNAHICVVEHMKGSVMDYEIATLDAEWLNFLVIRALPR